MTGTRRLVDRIADAVLYEGYMLYPYRPSAVKNRQRFNFGVLYPEDAALSGADRCFLQTECLVDTHGAATLDVAVRFLHLVARVSVRDAVAQPWQEAIEREVRVDGCTLRALAAGAPAERFSFPATENAESLGADGETPGVVVRRQRRLEGEVLVSATPSAGGVVRVRVRVTNRTPVDGAPPGRDELLLRSLVSAHVILRVAGGEFVSLLEPPEGLAELAAGCENIGAWPVLAGEGRQRDTMLASPIILYDHPEIAPESAGDLFDGTEIDEILSLRIMTLTDDEKREMWQSDERARLILQRTESLAAEQMMRMHGVMRRQGPLPEKVP